MNETNVRHLLLLISNSLLFSLTLVNLALKSLPQLLIRMAREVFCAAVRP